MFRSTDELDRAVNHAVNLTRDQPAPAPGLRAEDGVRLVPRQTDLRVRKDLAMNRTSSCRLSGMLQFVFAAVLLGLPLANPSAARAQDVVVSGLLRPAKLIQTPLGNLLVAEVGTAVNNSSRISIVDEDGNRRTLIDGLPSAINAVNTPTGASGLYLHGRTLYVTVGEGDVTKPGPIPRTEVANPTPASPVFSSVLAVHFSAAAERRTTGVTLNLADHHALKAGQKLVRSDASGQKITIELVADFPDYTP